MNNNNISNRVDLLKILDSMPRRQLCLLQGSVEETFLELLPADQLELLEHLIYGYPTFNRYAD